jgi:dipeptidyl aminopeptidase/acylaminoacyl peptidase
MKRPGFEADRYVLMLFDRSSGKQIAVTPTFDRSVGEVFWARDGRALFFTAEDGGYRTLYKVAMSAGEKSLSATKLTDKIFIGDIDYAADGKFFVIGKTTVQQPQELWKIDTDGKNLLQLTHTNDAAIAQLEMNPLEEFQFKGAGSTPVHGFLLKPPFFDPSKKYPMIYLIHGGPQGSWGDMNHYRWNVQMFASQGYVVVMVNPRGSTGYGQKFTDEISQDWGGKVYNDLVKGVEYSIKAFPFIDKDRIAAAGASYGGYMVNWLEGHNDAGLFKVLVSHDGMFNPVSAYGTTEELWFNEWEFGGTPWNNPALFEKYAPCKFVKKFKTPMLVVHGQLDYRLDVSEGFQLFTALQQMNVPSKFLYFPDEGHWVMKPQNSELWYATVMEWIGRYLKK